MPARPDLDLTLRVAGTLVLLYAQIPTRTVELTEDDVITGKHLILHAVPVLILIPPPLASWRPNSSKKPGNTHGSNRRLLRCGSSLDPAPEHTPQGAYCQLIATIQYSTIQPDSSPNPLAVRHCVPWRPSSLRRSSLIYSGCRRPRLPAGPLSPATITSTASSTTHPSENFEATASIPVGVLALDRRGILNRSRILPCGDPARTVLPHDRAGAFVRRLT